MATKATRLAKRYAKMLFNATGLEQAEETLRSLELITSMVETNRDIKNFFMNPKVSEEERIQATEVIAEKLSLTDEMKKFLLYIVNRRAITTIDEITRHYRSMYYEKQRKAKATVITPIAVDAEYEKRLIEALRRLTDRDVEIEYRVEPELIGGIVVKVGSTMYDSSIKGQLRLLKEELIKG